MYLSHTISAKQLSGIHNGLSKLHFVIEDLENIVSPVIVERLKQSFESIQESVEEALKKEDEAFENRRKHFQEMANLHNINNSIWSIFEVENLNNPHNFKNFTNIVYIPQRGMNEIKINKILTPKQAPLWIHLFKAADHLIQLSGDNHHVFIESFAFNENTGALELQTGS
jgi:hypothetical protein